MTTARGKRSAAANVALALIAGLLSAVASPALADSTMSPATREQDGQGTDTSTAPGVWSFTVTQLVGEPQQLHVRLDAADGNTVAIATAKPEPGLTFTTDREVPAGTYELTASIDGGSPDDGASVSLAVDPAGDPFVEPEPCLPDPHPCGGEWPEGLEGPFDFKVEYVDDVPSSTFEEDGVELRGWIARPKVPEGVKVPTILQSGPYFGTCFPSTTWGAYCGTAPSNPGFWEDFTPSNGATMWGWLPWYVSANRLAEEGYAVAFFSVRGTGSSGGCFSMHGADERADQAALVDWVAAQPWSNGRVGMGGLSYPSVTGVEAAIERPEALKTIVASGTISNYYSFVYTPQGATDLENIQLEAQYMAGPAGPPLGETIPTRPPASWTDPNDPAYAEGRAILTSGGARMAETYTRNVGTRVCEDLVKVGTEPATGFATGIRDVDYFTERDFLDDLGNVDAAVLLAQGFDDNDSVAFQDSPFWNLLHGAPKRQLVGPWGHDFPAAGLGKSGFPFEVPDAWEQKTWEDTLISWFDYWLKGIGSPESLRLGTVDFMDREGEWRESAAWPPAEARDEVLYTSGSTLSAQPGLGSETFLSAPSSRSPLCEADTNSLVYEMPVTEDITIAGNPFAYLNLGSDQPGGVVGAYLLDVDPSALTCEDGQPVSGVRLLSFGAADLRFHRGMVADDFPVGTPEHVRIDLFDLAEKVPAGHELVLVLSLQDPMNERDDLLSNGYFPNLTVHGDGGAASSQVVLPVVSGTLGGSAPTVAYPPRPFVPQQ